jgi:tetratricopeptide (TPR) repeat protein
MQVWWRTHLAFWHQVNGRYDRSSAVIAEARGIAERYGLAAHLFEIDHAVALTLLSKGDYAVAAELLQTMERRLSPARRMDWAYFHHLQANLEQRLGHFGNAAKAAERAVDLARETGLPSVQLPHFLADKILVVEGMCQCGDSLTPGQKMHRKRVRLRLAAEQRKLSAQPVSKQAKEFFGVCLSGVIEFGKLGAERPHRTAV